MSLYYTQIKEMNRGMFSNFQLVFQYFFEKIQIFYFSHYNGEKKDILPILVSKGPKGRTCNFVKNDFDIVYYYLSCVIACRLRHSLGTFCYQTIHLKSYWCLAPGPALLPSMFCNATVPLMGYIGNLEQRLVLTPPKLPFNTFFHVCS